jgi:hypothetical protein
MESLVEAVQLGIVRILIIATYFNVIETLDQIVAFVPLENLRLFWRWLPQVVSYRRPAL